MDIFNLKFMRTGDLEVLHPVTKEPLGWVVTFAGPGHPKTVEYNRKESARMLRRQQSITPRLSIEEVRRENVGSIVARILSWTPVRLAADAEPVVFDDAVATAMLLDPDYSWLLRQFLDFLDAPASFLGMKDEALEKVPAPADAKAAT